MWKCLSCTFQKYIIIHSSLMELYRKTIIVRNYIDYMKNVLNQIMTTFIVYHTLFLLLHAFITNFCDGILSTIAFYTSNSTVVFYMTKRYLIKSVFYVHLDRGFANIRFCQDDLLILWRNFQLNFIRLAFVDSKC